MIALLWGSAGSIVTFIIMAAVGDMVSEEVRDRLDHLPHTVLRLAARRLDAGQRAAMYDDEWMPELTYILKGDEARPITRLYHGTRFALGIFFAAGQIARALDHPAPGQPRIASGPRSLTLEDAERMMRTGLERLRDFDRNLAVLKIEVEKTCAVVEADPVLNEHLGALLGNLEVRVREAIQTSKDGRQQLQVHQETLNKLREPGE